MDGILNLNKPPGMTSFRAVATVRRLTGIKRVGHAGTLDPDASGVLPIGLGRGTRVLEFLMNSRKVYRAEIKLGWATDTYDASGQTTQQGDASQVTRADFEAALGAFHGPIKQTPPMYSAVKHQGKRLYELARAGVEVARPSRTVHIYDIRFLGWQPPLATIEVTCGKGTYIRSLAHDLGQALGCGAHLQNLVRLRTGLFDIKDTISLDQLADACHYGYWQELVFPLDIVLADWSAVVVDEITTQKVRNGQPLSLENIATPFPELCRAYGLDGCFLGVLRFHPESKKWQPEKVFR